MERDCRVFQRVRVGSGVVVLSRLLMVLLVTLICSPVAAQKIECVGTESPADQQPTSCGAASAKYAYKVTVDTSHGREVDTVLIGTHDGIPAHYALICNHAGWSFAVVSAASVPGFNHPHRSSKTAHGGTSSVDGYCPYVIVFADAGGGPIMPGQSFTFGFDNVRPPHDADWYLGGGLAADFTQPVGTGFGPVHSPSDSGDVPPPTGSIYGKKWHDWNHNGISDSLEPDVSGWPIVAYGPGVVETTFTDFRGTYGFPDLAPGAYTVAEDSAFGWERTFPLSATYDVTVVAGMHVIGLNFGNVYSLECPRELNCCGGRPKLCESVPLDTPYVQFGVTNPFKGQIAVADWHAAPPFSAPYVLGIVDLTPQCSQTEGVLWGPTSPWPGIWHNETGGTGNIWNQANLGDIFGLCLDADGNIYAAATSIYGTSWWCPNVNYSVYTSSGPGAVFKINGATGVITLFATLPNIATPSQDQLWASLGDITYDCADNVFFVSDFEDGMIYRVPPTGGSGPFQSYDHGVAGYNNTCCNGIPIAGIPPLSVRQDNNTAGMTQPIRRVWALKVIDAKFNGVRKRRLYYSIWREDKFNPDPTANNEIWSVGLSAGGHFILSGSDGPRLEVKPPALTTGVDWSNPVASISFKPNGTMLLAERGMDTRATKPSNCLSGPGWIESSPHFSRLLEYYCSCGDDPCILSTWKLQSGSGGSSGQNLKYEVSVHSPNSPPPVKGCGSAGGVDFDWHTGYPPQCLTGTEGRVWVTGDALRPFTTGQLIYGLQGIRYVPTVGSVATSLLIDLDRRVDVYNKTEIGDVAIPCCFSCLSTGDVNGDGNGLSVADYLALIKFVYFMGPPPTPLSQGDLNGDGYIDQADLDVYNCYFKYGMSCFPQYPVPVPCCTDTVRGCCETSAGNYVRSPANCALLGGTYLGDGTTCPCYPVPKNTALWLSFDEGTPGPSMNGAVAYNGIQHGSLVTVPGEVNSALEFDGATSYVEVPSYWDINLGASDFSIDAWVYRLPGDNGVRVITDKRSDVGGYFGYQFFLYDGRLGCQLADGTYTIFTTLPSEIVPATGWHHVAVTVDRNGVGQFYLDGLPFGATFNPASRSGSLSSNVPLRVGAYSFGVGYVFHGGIDEVEIFRRALTQPEIQGIYDAQNIGKCRCYCPHQGDINGDGVIGVNDVLGLIRVAFLNGADVQDPLCPRTRSDVNNDGVVNVNDVLYLIKTAFVNGPYPVNPCGP